MSGAFLVEGWAVWSGSAGGMGEGERRCAGRSRVAGAVEGGHDRGKGGKGGGRGTWGIGGRR